MPSKYIIDTNIVIAILQNNKTILDLLDGKELFISFITELEILSFSKITQEEDELIHQYLKDIKIIELNNYIKKETILLRRKYKTKLADTIILASSNYMGIPLLTRDKELQKAAKNVRIVLLDT